MEPSALQRMAGVLKGRICLGPARDDEQVHAAPHYGGPGDGEGRCPTQPIDSAERTLAGTRRRDSNRHHIHKVDFFYPQASSAGGLLLAPRRAKFGWSRAIPTARGGGQCPTHLAAWCAECKRYEFLVTSPYA